MWKYNQTLPNELYHFGIIGMRWGHRKPEEDEINGRRRGQSDDDYEPRELTTQEKHEAHLREYGQQQSETDEAQRAANRRKVMIGVAAVAALGLVAYGVHKSKQSKQSNNNGPSGVEKNIMETLADGKSIDISGQKSGSSYIDKFKSIGDNGSSMAGGKSPISGSGRNRETSTNLFQLIGDASSMSGGKLPNARSKGKLTRNKVRKAPLVSADTPVKNIASNTDIMSVIEKILYGNPRSKPAK